MQVIDDPRHVTNGWEIPSEGYADQPYIMRTDDGAWLCALTTGPGHEGAGGQHIIATRSTDKGRTWSDPVAVEPSDGPEASYAVLLKAKSGRIYCFYNHNTDNVREVKTEDGGVFSRVDSLGHYVFKYSDDHGRTWSAERYDVPVREFACDRQNIYEGELRFFWNVGRPLICGDVALLVLHKVGAMGAGFFAQSEGVFLRSDNILTESNPRKIRFETLPDGDYGLRTPPGGGRIAEEQSVVALSDGSLFCVYRTIDGYPAYACSRDDGVTWSEPEYLTNSPGGKLVKHPRAANFIWKCANGQYLYWFHNHGGNVVHKQSGWDPYNDRNPAWLMSAREIDGQDGKMLEFSQPEILLYDDDPMIRMSYPDLLEEDEHFFVTETQKETARVHAIDPTLLHGLFTQWENRTATQEELLLELPGGKDVPSMITMPALPAFLMRDHTRMDFATKDLRAGFTVELALTLYNFTPGQVIFDSRMEGRQGILISTTEYETIGITISDGRQQCSWSCDRGMLSVRQMHYLSIIVDGGPNIISFVVDGTLNDGGDYRQFGWGRFSPTLMHANGAPVARIAQGMSGQVHALRLYGRALRISETIGNFRSVTETLDAH